MIRLSRSPHGERGLKCIRRVLMSVRLCRSPHGERGLKFIALIVVLCAMVSLPSRGARIEILIHLARAASLAVAPLTGSAD